ncbi:MAG TPA: penicillin acylase family protein, partial [Longimicrobiales bacterium]|nr:penicillin acylase family protein [Longimicrobiales bacterium]
MRMLLDAYAAGMNGWLATRPADELRVLDGIEPWYPLALIRFKYYLNEFLGYAGLRDAWVTPLFERSAALARGPAIASLIQRDERSSVASHSPRDDRSDAARQTVAPQTAAPQTVAFQSDTRAGSAQYAFTLESQLDEFGVRPHGSNEWAVAPSLTADGSAMLLINPHQSFVGVQRYAEIHLDSREGLRFSGLTVFGFLLPYMGHNDRLGWAYTDNYADHSDLYGITFDDAAQPLRYRYDAGHRTAQTWDDAIRVRTDDGMTTRTFRFWSTHHGPIVGIADDGRPLAVRLARMDEGRWYDQWDAMIRARTLEDWKRGVAMLHVAYMNTMYADADGNIGYIYNSAVPRRNAGIDPSGILDGSDPATEWQGFHTIDELPQVWNPATGWLLNTNSTPFTATTGLAWSRDDFPSYMVGGETDNARAVSSRRVLSTIDDVTFERFAGLVWDSHLSEAGDMISPLNAELAAMPASPARDSIAHVIERLNAWDRTADTASIETTWFVLTAERYILAREGYQAAAPNGADTPWIAALTDALHRLRTQWNTIDVPWGSINRHQRPLPGAPIRLDPSRESLAVGGAHGQLGSVFTFYSEPFGEASPRLGRGGNSFVKVVAFGPTVRAASILNYGQSGDPASSHFFDQASLYARRQFKPAWFDRSDVEANAVRSYAVPIR